MILLLFPSQAGRMFSQCSCCRLFQALFVTIICSEIHGQLNTVPSLNIEVNPTSRKIAVGGTVSILCSIQGDVRNVGLLWYRNIGDIGFHIGSDNILSNELLNSFGSRYQLQRFTSNTLITTFNLTVSGAFLEDSATYQCILSPFSSVNVSSSVVVCGDVSSEYCDCMLGRGWGAPDCYANLEASGSNYYYNQHALIGLGISLLVTVLYAVVIGLLYGRDWIYQLHKKRLEKARQENARMRTKNLKSTSEVLGKPAFNSSDHIQLDPSDSSSDTVDTVASSSATGNGSEESSGYQSSNASKNLSTGFEYYDKEERPTNRNPSHAESLYPQVYVNQSCTQDSNGRLKTTSIPVVSKKSASKQPKISIGNISGDVHLQDAKLSSGYCHNDLHEQVSPFTGMSSSVGTEI